MTLYRDFRSQEAIDAQYDLVRSVDDPAPLRRFNQVQSEAARERLDARLGLRFGPTLDEHLDVFPGEPGGPILVFIHGGYWRSGTSQDYSLVALGPVARGVTVVVTNYALCPKVGIEEITRQSRAALAWVWTRAEDFGADRERIYVAGHSAGAQQVAMLLATNWAGEYGLPRELIRGGLAISGVYDLRPLVHSFLQPKLQLTLRTVQGQSPLFNLPAAAPELIVSVGADEPEEFVRQSREFAAAWTGAGLPGRYWEQAGKNHWTALAGMVDARSELCRALFELMARSG